MKKSSCEKQCTGVYESQKAAQMLGRKSQSKISTPRTKPNETRGDIKSRDMEIRRVKSIPSVC